MAKYFVAGNFLNRESEQKYLVRPVDSQIADYKEAPALKIGEFQFCVPSTGEEGFGCYLVCECGEPEPLAADAAIPDEAIKIRFNGFAFQHEAEATYIETGKELFLLANGEMYYIPA